MSTLRERLGLLGLMVVLVAPGRSEGQGKVIAPMSRPPVETPLSLTASDGSGLELVSLGAQVVVEDPLAFTELHLVFRNPENRVREGRFRITLPSRAVISRFAMKIDGRFQEGEVVELQAARRAYEDFLHRRQDPALLETEAGNEFSARVFPIPARATKELIVSYSQELPRAGEPYRFPLKGLPKLGSLSIRALVGKADGGAAASSLGGTRSRHEVIEVDRRDFLPDRDFEVPLQATAGRLGLRHENLVVARVRPLEASLPPDPVRGLTVLFDTSASRALGFGDQLGQLTALLAALAKAGDFPISVAAFDQTVEGIYSGPASGFGAAERKLRERRALGASDLSKALAWASGQKAPRVLLVTDGVATAGDTANDKLGERVKALGGKGVERLDVLAVGGIRDDERLARLVAAGLPRAGIVLDGTLATTEHARRMGLATRSGLAVEVDGAAWVWPQRLDGVQSGDEVLVYADLPAARPLRVNVGGRAVATSGALAVAPRPLLERAWVKARLSRLMAQRDTLGSTDPDLAEALRKQVIDLSIKHRVLSPYTALLVLETEQDYARFGIERRALADILTVGPAGVAVLQRRDFVIAPQPRVAVANDLEGGAMPEAELLESPRDGRPRGDTGNEAAAPSKLRPPGNAPAEVAAAPRPFAAPPAPEAKMDSADRSVGRASAGAPAAPSASRPSPSPAPPPPAATAPAREESVRARRPTAPLVMPKQESVSPYEGRFEEVMALLRRGQRKEALAKALTWYEGAAGDVLALVAIGEAAEAAGDMSLAARAYGSIIDLFPGRADMRRFAGNRLERLRGGDALALAVDSYRNAVEQRPDHPASHRLLAFALVKAGHPAQAFQAIAAGARRGYPGGRFDGVPRILAEDLGLVAAAWTRAEPARAAEIRDRLERAGGRAETSPSLRFVLTWETDANDVDFHIYDGKGGHAFYGQRTLGSGGELYADVTTGYGPECFTIRAPNGGRAYPYKLQAHYYSRGPMGYGMGKLQIVEHDGRGGLRFEERPFVVMRDRAYVEMGTVAK